MKKWALTILAILGLVALGITSHLWIPWLTGFAGGHKEGVESLNNLADLVTKVVTSAAAVFVFIFKLWRENKSAHPKAAPNPAQTMQQVQAERDAIQAGGSVQTGGTRVVAEGPDSIAAGVVQSQTVIQHQTVIQQINPPQLNALHALPLPPADFTGRDTELAELRKAIEQGGVHISGLQGQGGVGKTALALKLAEELNPKYPDAQIYMDLRGVSEKPLTPAEALAYVVRACHPEAKLPESEAELRGVYLNVLHGKKALLLMDNARDAAQVAPLVPPQSCVLLVTSRLYFALPGLREKRLDVLPAAKAEELLLDICPRIDGQAGAIATLCGRLPLALRLAATALKEKVNLPPEDYVQRLEQNKLAALPAAGADPSMEASISLSYRFLDPEAQKRWRMLGIFPDTFDTRAAAVVWEVETAPGDVLGRLLQVSMLEWNDAAKRYRLHDLMRDFARARLDEGGETEGADRRHARYYLGVLSKADDLYKKGGESIKAGFAWLDLEWGNIQAGQAWAAAHADHDDEAARLCSQYPRAGGSCLDVRQHPRQSIRWLEAALAAARRLKDHYAEGEHLGNLGLAYNNAGEYRRAVEYHELALAIVRDLGIRRAEGSVLGNLGDVYANAGDVRRANQLHEQHLAIARKTGNRRSEGTALVHLGNDYYSLGERSRAIDYHDGALAIALETEDRRLESKALCGLGNAYQGLGRRERAIECYSQTLAISRELGDQRSECEALGNIGIVHAQAAEFGSALECFERVLAIEHAIGDLHGEATALWNMSLARDKLGERQKAIESAEAALKVYEQIEAPAAAKVRMRLEEWKKAEVGG